MKKILAILVLASLFPPACTVYDALTVKYVMDIYPYFDEDYPLENIKTVAIIIPETSNPLLDKEMAKIVARTFVEDSIKIVNDEPDAIIAFTYYSGPIKEYVPPRTYTQTQPGKLVPYTQYRPTDGKPYTMYHKEPDTYETVSLPGYEINATLRSIEISMFAADKLKNIGQDEDVMQAMIWKCKLLSTGSTSDIRMVAPKFLHHMMTEFPYKSGKKTRRSDTDYRY